MWKKECHSPPLPATRADSVSAGCPSKQPLTETLTWGARFSSPLLARAGQFNTHGSPPLHQLDRYPQPDHRSRPLQAAERNVVFRIQDTVNLGAARLEQRRHLVLGDFLFLHGLGELPRDDLFDRLRLRLFEDALLFEEVIKAGTHMFLAHRSNSFWRFRAIGGWPSHATSNRDSHNGCPVLAFFWLGRGSSAPISALNRGPSTRCARSG